MYPIGYKQAKTKHHYLLDEEEICILLLMECQGACRAENSQQADKRQHEHHDPYDLVALCPVQYLFYLAHNCIDN
jgi:hypothetical protein